MIVKAELEQSRQRWVAHVQGVGVIAPGLPSWQHAEQILTGAALWSSSPVQAQPQLLPPNERRRAPVSVLFALHAAEEAMRHGERDPNATPCVDVSTTASVFASSDAEMAIISRIATSLAEPARMVSPTDFHNSVHNTAAGYWGIAAKCSRATTTLAAYDGTCVAGLHEAMGVLADGEAAVLLVLYDVPAPAPLDEKRPIAFPFGTALLLTAQATATSIATLRRAEVAQETFMVDAALESLRVGNPSARILPLLAAIALRSHALIGIKDIGGTSVGVEVDARPR